MLKTNQQGNIMLLFVVTISVVAIGFFIVKSKIAVAPVQSPTPSGVACSLEAKLCPDGSYVGRTGPKCEFAPCPTTTNIGTGIAGKVTLGPTCPVQRVDDPSCDDKPYQGEFIVEIYDGVSTSEFTRFSSNTTGNYSIKLPPGDYIIRPTSNIGIGAQVQYVTIRPGEMKVFNFTLDTGIR